MTSKAPHILLGGGPGIIVSSTTEEVASILSHVKTLPIPIYAIDTAAIYPSTNPNHSETVLGKAGIADSGLEIFSKVLLFQPGKKTTNGTLSAENIEKSVDDSLRRLKIKKLNTIYAHHPDKVTPAAEVVAAFGKVLRDGKATSWGVSNFTPDFLRGYLAECEKQGVPKPAIYQGMYHAACRGIEEDLFPLLREHGMKYFAYAPSAGGFLSDKVVKSKGADMPSRYIAGWRYNPGVDGHKPEIIEALTSVYEKSAAHGFSLYSAALRWLMYHSHLGENDGIILGASKREQVDDSVTELAKGKLPSDVVEEFEKFWVKVKDFAPVSYQELEM